MRRYAIFNGSETEYRMLHYWVEKVMGRPAECSSCDKTTGTFEWSNISGEYKREKSDWRRLCPSCHRRIDINGAIDICRRGHKLTKQNIYIRRSRVQKECRTCRAMLRQNKRESK